MNSPANSIIIVIIIIIVVVVVDGVFEFCGADRALHNMVISLTIRELSEATMGISGNTWAIYVDS